jgi:truncated hemoglobin YjbI
MARGWESKAIEEQISAAEAKQEARAKQQLTAPDAERQRLKQGLMLERARIVREMEKSHKRRYLVLLERALKHVEAELAKLD